MIVVALPGEEARAARLAAHLDAPLGAVRVHTFPDGESLVRLDADVTGRTVVFVRGLDRPDAKMLPLLFALRTARELGAASVGLVAPYLCYMRQDRRFHPGEAVAARLFADLLSPAVDWLVAVDPHLHRLPSLDAVYSAPSVVVHAASAIADWVRAHVPDPLLVGPDEESAQWAAEVAAGAGAPHVVLTKTRRGDREVEIHAPDLSAFRGKTPVLVDDIVSTGRTLAATAERLRAAGLPPAVVVAVHALFAEGAAEALAAAGVGRVVSCDTVAHPTNAIALDAPLAAAVRRFAR